MAFIAAECLSIDSTSVCAPWSRGLFINSDVLAKRYSKKTEGFTAQLWEKSILANQRDVWHNFFGCSNFADQKVQYQLSYDCLNDIFVHSSNCNTQFRNQIPTCSSITKLFDTTVNAMMNNETVCFNENQEFNTRRNQLKNIGRVFDERSKLGYFRQDQCIQGFGGNSQIATAFCKQKNDPCCQSFNMDRSSIHMKIDSAKAPGEKNELPWYQQPLNIIGTALGIIAFGILVGILGIAVKKSLTKVNREPSKSYRQLSNFGSTPREDVYRVIKSHVPTNADEIDLRVGDLISFYGEIDEDGWGFATNLTSLETGRANTKITTYMTQ
ncbi:hypothetical protein HDV02_005737 [Globomyces sp. JEL0801]|nr:hypothetical protein HDV02_005737 [Globomyces sp. JEL0801]